MNLRRIIRNVLSNYILFGASAAATLILTPLLFRDLRPVRFALLSFALALAALFAMMDLGLSSALVRHVSRLRASQKDDDAHQLASAAFWLLSLLGPALAGAMAAIGLAGSSLFHLGTHGLVVPLVGLALIFQLPAGAIRGYLHGCEEFERANAVDISAIVLKTLAIIVFLRQGFGLYSVALVFPCVAALQWMGLLVVASFSVSPFRPRLKNVSWLSLRPVWRFTAQCFVQEAALPIFGQTDVLLAAKWLSMPAVAILVIARKFPSAVSRLAQATLEAATPIVSSAEAGKNIAAIRRFIIIASRNTLAVSLPLCVGLAVWTRVILQSWIGAGALAGVGVLRIFLIFAGLVALAETPLTLFYGVGKIRASLMAYLAAIATVALLSRPLCRSAGLTGLAILFASVQAAITASLLWRALRLYGIRVTTWTRDAFIPVSIAAVPASGALWLTHQFLRGDIVSVCLSISATLMVFVAAYVFYVTKPQPMPWRMRIRIILTGAAQDRES